MIGHGRILIGYIAIDYGTTALATGADTAALTIVKPDASTVTVLPDNVTKVMIQNSAAADGVRLRAGGQDVVVVGQAAVLEEVAALMYKGQAITARSINGAVSSGKLYVALYN